jgi:hypothetical protein
MSDLIRKISIGPNYKSSMNYVVGQKILGDNYTIHLIEQDKGNIKIWIERGDEVMLWKSFSVAMPSSIEYNINF